MKKLLLSLTLIGLHSWALNPLAALTEPLPTQHLVVSNKDKVAQTQVIDTRNNYENSIEEVIVFALQAAVATFHIAPNDLTNYKPRIQKYYTSTLLPDVEKKVLAGTGVGICDIQLLQNKTCSAITRDTVTVDKKQGIWHVSLPLRLADQSTLDMSFTIRQQAGHTKPFTITAFEIKDHEHPKL